MLLSNRSKRFVLIPTFCLMIAVAGLCLAGEEIDLDGLALPIPEVEPGQGINTCETGWAAYLRGDILKAEEEFQGLLAQEPHNPFAYFGIETLANGKGLYREAFSQAMEATRNAVASPWFEVFLSDAIELFVFSEEPERLINFLQELQTREDISYLNHLIVSHALADAYENSGQAEAAIATRAKLPFIRDWLLLGPFNNRDKSGFDRGSEVEGDLPKIDFNKEYEGRNEPVKWFRPMTLAEHGYFNLSAILYPHEENIAYACTQVEVAGETQATLIFGGGGVSEIWVNGKKSWAWKSYFRYHPFQRLLPITLQPGVNQIVIKTGGERDAKFGISLMILPNTIEGLNQSLATDAIKLRPSIRIALDKPVSVNNLESSTTDPLATKVDDDTGLAWGATGFFRAYLDKYPKNPMALTGLGYLYLQRGLDDKHNLRTRPLFETAAQVAPRCPLFLGLASFVQQDANVGRDYLRRALASHPDETMASEHLLRQYYQGGLSREAETMADTILERQPSAEAYKILAQIKSHRQWGPEARADLREAGKLKPGDVSIYNMLAQLADGEEESLQIIRQGIARTGSYSLRRTLVLKLLPKSSIPVEELVEPLCTNLKLNPYSLEDYFLLRDCYQREGDLAKAEKVITEALSYLPEQPMLLESLGRLQILQGNETSAIKHWKRSLAIAPDNPRLREYLEEVEPRRATFYDPYGIPLEELLKTKPEIQAYARYNTVTLLDQGVMRVNPNGTSDRLIHFTQMALTQKGAQSLSQYQIGYDPQRERVEVLSAKVIQPDGSVLSASDIRDRSGNYVGDGGIYSQYHFKSISLPQVVPMSIIDIKYLTEATGENLYGNEFEDTFFFGSEEPTLRFQYVMDTPAGFEVTVKTFRQEEVGVTEESTTSDGRLIRKWEGKDLPGMEMEPAMPPYEELAPCLRGSSFENWDAVGNWYWNLSKEFFELPESIVEDTQKLVENAATEEEKLAEIYYHVIDKVRYVGIELGRNGYVPHKAERTYRTTYGDCKDTATLFVSLLKAVGIEARVALIRTWERGQEPTGLPGAQRFNHAICYVPDVNGKDYWLDGTTDYNHFSELPTMDQGATALITGPDGGTLTLVPEDPATANGETIDCTIALQPDSSATLEAQFNAHGAFAPSRRAGFETPDAMRKNFENFLKRLFAGAELEDFSTSKPDLREKEAFFKIKVTVPKIATETSGGKRLKPCFLPQRFSRRFAVQNERKHDLIIGLNSFRKLNLRLVLPAGAKPVTIPDDYSYNTPFGKLARKVTVEGQLVHFEMETQIKTRRIALKDYPAWRAFCHQVDAAEEEWIVYEETSEASE
ncbi:MAG: DUF3857 domain-containing protein [Planctomycetes bacterium]|nr:DUF3857 domain-containing protein [Planctomycetota bacterium]